MSSASMTFRKANRLIVQRVEPDMPAHGSDALHAKNGWLKAGWQGHLFAPRLVVILVFVIALTATQVASAVATGTPVEKATVHPSDTSWPMYALNYAGTRYSDLAAVNTRTVSRLGKICSVQVGSAGIFESSLLLADGLLYVTTSDATVALDPTDCAVIWKNVYIPPGAVGPYTSNRGPAYDSGRIFRGTIDCRLLALEAKSGGVIWKVKACDPAGGGWLAAAPVVWDGMVFIGTAGGDWGVAGQVFAFDAQSGREVWHFDTVPRPGDGEPGGDTWKGDLTKRAGGASWTSMSLDPASGELFVPVGNAAPDFNAKARGGSDLFTDSLVVLDAKTGALRWWYQLMDRDDKDLDLAAPPLLFHLKDGTPAVALGSKDGYLYIINRKSHRLVSKTRVTTVLNQSESVSPGGITTCPGTVGGVEWNGPAYDRLHQDVVVGAVDWCAFETEDAKPQYKRGQLFLGGTYRLLANPPPSGWVTAVKPESGRVLWRFHAEGPVVSGVTPTGGGLVFFGDMRGNLYALNSNDGTVQFKSYTGGAVAGGIITYRIDGRQYVAATSGNVSRSGWGIAGLPHVVIYGLPSELAKPGDAAGSPALASSDLAAPDLANGKAIYSRVCAACHGDSGEGMAGPRLRNIGRRLSASEIAAWIMNPVVIPGPGPVAATMPQLYPSPLTRQQVVDIAAYVNKF